MSTATSAAADDTSAATASAPTAARAAAPARNDALLAGRGDMMRTIRDLVAMAPRATGTPGGRRAAEYVADRLRSAGMDKVWMEKSTSYSWKASGASLSVGGTKLDVNPIGFSFIKGPTGTGVRTLGPKGLTAEVVDLGGDPLAALKLLDVRGKFVMIDLKFLLPLAGLTPFIEFIYDPDLEVLDLPTLLATNPYITTLSQTIQALEAAGAAGMIGVLADYFDSNKYHNEYYRRTPMRIPGMWVTKREAASMRALLKKSPRATMRLTTTRRKVVARTPIGILNGRSKDTIMVQSHHDSLGPGAVEDASGVAEVLALAEYYGAMDKRGARRDKTLMFTTFDTHFTGYQAHMAFVDKYIKSKKSPYPIVANTTIEHIAKKGVIRKDKLVFTDETEPRGFFENVSLPLKLKLAKIIVDRDLRGTTLLNGTVFTPLGIPTDASFVLAAGVPTVSLIAGPIYLYDEADTIEAVDQPELKPMLLAQRDLIDAFDATPSRQMGLLPITLPGLG